MSSPLVIGGTGGSGTRVVARIVRRAGRYMGSDLNSSEDAMPFAHFDWKWGLDYLRFGSNGAMQREFDEVVARHLADLPSGARWGWKHPHSYLLLPFLHERFPDMRFIHVVRDGRDIALSGNQQQARHYGPLLGETKHTEPIASAAWWQWANLKARADADRLGSAYLAIRFEDLCAEPLCWTDRIVKFADGAGVRPAAEIASPGSIGRWRQHPDRHLIRAVEASCADGLGVFGYPKRSL